MLHQPIQHIAIVGISDKPDRPSFQVAAYLHKQGFTIIPVNPLLENWRGITAYPSLGEIPKTVHVDTVDIFRKPVFVPEIVAQAIARGTVHTIWMQEGSYSGQAYEAARQAGIRVVAHMCMMAAHKTDGNLSIPQEEP